MERVEKLLAQLTLEEKVAMVSGSGPWHSTAIPRLGIPCFKMSDGPHGVRGDATSGATAACFPVGSALAATWNPELIERVGSAVGDEARSKGVQVVLGPTVNLHRSPLGGRNFECYSEDPWLTARMAVAFVSGVQSRGVGACVKHFVCNECETDRHLVSAEVSERALRELYLLPFETAVREAAPWSIMSAYNRINGIFASSHRELLTGILKEECGFEGFVVSDWGASLHTVENANGGLDLEMPGPARSMGEKLVAAVRAGEVDEATVDDKVRRLLRVLVLSGRLDDPAELEERSEDRPEHRALARRVATEAMVLLRNEGVLPLDPRELRTLAVIGPNAETGRIQGGGSSAVPPHYVVHPLAAIRERLGEGVRVLHEPGCTNLKYAPPFDVAELRASDNDAARGFTAEYFAGSDFSGPPLRRALETRSRLRFFGMLEADLPEEGFSLRLSARFTPTISGVHEFGLASAGQSRLLIDGEVILDHWAGGPAGETFMGFGSAERRAPVSLEAGREVALRIDYVRPRGQSLGGVQFGVLPPQPTDAIERAVRAAREASAAILVVGTDADWETEGNDRHSMALPGRQVALIEAVCAVNPKTIVVVNTGSPVESDWLARTAAVLHVWLPGQEFGNALADVLFGDASPSGRLPSTIPVRLEDTPAFTSWPGENHRVLYGEDLFAGYRWYDARKIEPRFPFGHGLAYTTFAYDALEVAPQHRRGDEVPVRVRVTNTGSRAGQEVVQLYVGPREPRLRRPPKELRAFAKLELAPGEGRSVALTLGSRAFAVWDTRAHDWVVDPGEYELLVGASSRDIRARATLTLV